ELADHPSRERLPGSGARDQHAQWERHEEQQSGPEPGALHTLGLRIVVENAADENQVRGAKGGEWERLHHGRGEKEGAGESGRKDGNGGDDDQALVDLRLAAIVRSGGDQRSKYDDVEKWNGDKNQWRRKARTVKSVFRGIECHSQAENDH